MADTHLGLRRLGVEEEGGVEGEAEEVPDSSVLENKKIQYKETMSK